MTEDEQKKIEAEEVIRRNVRRKEVAQKVFELHGKARTYTEIVGRQHQNAVYDKVPSAEIISLPRNGRDVNKADNQDAYILEVIEKDSSKQETTKLTFEVDKDGEVTLDMDESRTIPLRNDNVPTVGNSVPKITFYANEDDKGKPEQSDRIVIEYNGYRLGIDVGQSKSLDPNVSNMKFDLLLLTHFDIDHIGDKWNEDRAAKMIEEGKVSFAMFGNSVAKTDAGHEFQVVTALNAKESKIGAIAHGARKGDDGQFLQRKVFLGDRQELIKKGGQIDYTKARNGEANGIFIETLGPLREHRTMNNNSLITKVTCPGMTILSLGDAEVDALQDMYEYAHKKDINLKCDILKLPHHGSFTCINEDGRLNYEAYNKLYTTFLDINKRYESYEDALKNGKPGDADLYKEFIIARIIKEANPRICSVCCSHTDPSNITAGKVNDQVIDVCKKLKKPLKRTARSGNITARALKPFKEGFVEVTEQRAALNSKQYSGNLKDDNLDAARNAELEAKLGEFGKKVTIYNKAGVDVQTKIYSKDESSFVYVTYDEKGKEKFSEPQISDSTDTSSIHNI